MKYSDKQRTKKNLILGLALLISFNTLAGCSSNVEVSGKEGANASTFEDRPINVGIESEEYSDYVKSAIDEVSGKNTTPTPTAVPENSRVVNVARDGFNDTSPYVSASESLPEDSGVTPTFTPKSNTYMTDESEEESEETEEESEVILNSAGYPVTPDEFEVGKSVIYINGEIDDTYGSDIITAINKARTDLGYDPYTEKKGLDTCANRRTREITCFLSHMRPDASPFYSLAPEYFKAEMLAIDGATAAETVDAWIRDPNSRSLVFSTKFTSVGAACFKCNGLNCVVVALGY